MVKNLGHTILFIILLSSLKAVSQINESSVRIQSCSIGGMNNVVERAVIFDLYMMLENTGKTDVYNVGANIDLPDGVLIIKGEQTSNVGTLYHRQTKALNYSLYIGNDYKYSVANIAISISYGGDGERKCCYTIPIAIGQPMGNVAVNPYEPCIEASQKDTIQEDTIKKESVDNRQERHYCVVSVQRLNVRAECSTSSAVVGRVYLRDTIEYYAIKSGWVEIDYEGRRAFVSSKYVSKIDIPVIEEPIVEEKTEEEYSPASDEYGAPLLTEESNQSGWGFRFVPSLSMGLSNLVSSSANSNAAFAMGVDAAVQLSGGFLPQWWMSELSMGFILLGNSIYSFPSLNIDLLPMGYRTGYRGYYYYVVGGLSIIVPLEYDGIRFSRNMRNYNYRAQSSILFAVKAGFELNNRWLFGALWMHGFNDVCQNLPIGIKHDTFQLFGAIKLGNF